MAKLTLPKRIQDFFDARLGASTPFESADPTLPEADAASMIVQQSLMRLMAIARVAEEEVLSDNEIAVLSTYSLTVSIEIARALRDSAQPTVKLQTVQNASRLHNWIVQQGAAIARQLKKESETDE